MCGDILDDSMSMFDLGGLCPHLANLLFCCCLIILSVSHVLDDCFTLYVPG